MEHYTQWLVYILVLYSIGILIKVGGGAHSSHYPGGLHKEFAMMKNEKVYQSSLGAPTGNLSSLAPTGLKVETSL